MNNEISGKYEYELKLSVSQYKWEEPDSLLMNDADSGQS